MAKILVIDDHAEIRDLFADVLADAGHEVITASDGALGLALYARHRPILVITDLQVPEIWGLEIIAQLGPKPGVQIIAISGSGVENLESARRLGATLTFRKPFAIQDLAETVSVLVGGVSPAV
jgi:CheY-like chemotaxis protein